MKQVIVLALLEAKPGFEEQLKQKAQGLVEPTLAEQGCIKYTLHQDRENPLKLMFYEIWESQEDLDRHSKSSHLAEFAETAGDMLAIPADITTWTQVAG